LVIYSFFLQNPIKIDLSWYQAILLLLIQIISLLSANSKINTGCKVSALFVALMVEF
jgi:hypothetical protein